MLLTMLCIIRLCCQDKGVSHTVARLCALLIDAAYFIAQKR